MKFIKRFFGLFCLAFVCTLVLSAGKAKAYSPIIASCSNGVLDNTIIYVNGGNDVEQLFEVRLDHYYLDAVAVRLKSSAANKEARITVTDRDHGVIASKTQVVPTDEAWVYVDFDNVPMPRAVYFLKVESVENVQIAWKYTSGTCIEDSHLVNNGDPILDTDMAFAIYAYDSDSTDASTGDQTAPPAGTNNELVGETLSTGDAASSTNDSSSSSASSSKQNPGTSGSSQSTGNYPSRDDILAMTLGGQSDSPFSLFGLGLFSPILSFVLSLIGFFIFVGIIILIIVLIVRRKKKKSSQEQELEKQKKL